MQRATGAPCVIGGAKTARLKGQDLYWHVGTAMYVSIYLSILSYRILSYIILSYRFIDLILSYHIISYLTYLPIYLSTYLSIDLSILI